MDVLLLPTIYSYLTWPDLAQIYKSCKTIHKWMGSNKCDFLWDSLQTRDFPYTQFFDNDSPKRKVTRTKLQRYMELCMRYRYWEWPERDSEKKNEGEDKLRMGKLRGILREACERDLGTLLAIPIHTFPQKRIVKCLHVIWRVLAAEGNYWIGCEEVGLWYRRCVQAAFSSGFEMVHALVQFTRPECLLFGNQFCRFAISNLDGMWFFRDVSLDKRVFAELLDQMCINEAVSPGYTRIYQPLSAEIRDFAMTQPKEIRNKIVRDWPPRVEPSYWR